MMAEQAPRRRMSIYDGMYVAAMLAALGPLTIGPLFMYTEWHVLFRVGFSLLHCIVYLIFAAAPCYRRQEWDWFSFWLHWVFTIAVVTVVVFGAAFFVGF